MPDEAALDCEADEREDAVVAIRRDPPVPVGMKHCRFCAAEIDMAELVCSACGRDLLTPVGPRYIASLRAIPSGRTRNIGLIGVGAAGLFLFAFFGEACAPATPQHAVEPTHAALANPVPDAS